MESTPAVWQPRGPNTNIPVGGAREHVGGGGGGVERMDMEPSQSSWFALFVGKPLSLPTSWRQSVLKDSQLNKQGEIQRMSSDLMSEEDNRVCRRGWYIPFPPGNTNAHKHCHREMWRFLPIIGMSFYLQRSRQILPLFITSFVCVCLLNCVCGLKWNKKQWLVLIDLPLVSRSIRPV